MAKFEEKEKDAVGWETWHKHFCASCYVEFEVLCSGTRVNPDHTIPALCPECWS